MILRIDFPRASLFVDGLILVRLVEWFMKIGLIMSKKFWFSLAIKVAQVIIAALAGYAGGNVSF